MSKRYQQRSTLLSDDDINEFRAAVTDVIPWRTTVYTDILSRRPAPTVNHAWRRCSATLQLSAQAIHDFIPEKQGYRRPQLPKEIFARLARGTWRPESTLDLHGYTQSQAKRALIRWLLNIAHAEYWCVSVIHGHGQQILKQQLPLWVSHCPDVIACYPAPARWGGNAALLLLLTPPNIACYDRDI